MPFKADLEIYYIQNISVRLYVFLIFATIWAVIRPDTAILKSFFPDLIAYQNFNDYISNIEQNHGDQN